MFSLQSISLKNCSFFLVYLLYFQLAGGVNEKLVDLTNFYRDLFTEEEKEYVVWDLDLNTIREVCKINLNKLLRQTELSNSFESFQQPRSMLPWKTNPLRCQEITGIRIWP